MDLQGLKITIVFFTSMLSIHVPMSLFFCSNLIKNIIIYEQG